MADKTIPALNTHDSPTAEDLLIIVDDPSGNPVNKKIRVDTLLSALSTDTTTRSVANKVQSRADTNIARDLNLRNSKTVLQPEVLKGEQDDMTVILGTLDMAENSVWHVEIDGTSSSALIIGNVRGHGDDQGANVVAVADTVTFVKAKATAGDNAEIWCDGTNWYCQGSTKATMDA